jgi:hypothetical protein
LGGSRSARQLGQVVCVCNHERAHSWEKGGGGGGAGGALRLCLDDLVEYVVIIYPFCFYTRATLIFVKISWSMFTDGTCYTVGLFCFYSRAILIQVHIWWNMRPHGIVGLVCSYTRALFILVGLFSIPVVHTSWNTLATH